MTFRIFTDTGQTYGPFGSLPLAQKHTGHIMLGNNKISRSARLVQLREIEKFRKLSNRELREMIRILRFDRNLRIAARCRRGFHSAGDISVPR